MYHWYLLIKHDKPRPAKEISSIIAGKSGIDVGAKTNKTWFVAGLIETIPFVSGLIAGFNVTDKLLSGVAIISGFTLSIIIILILCKKIPPAPIEIKNNKKNDTRL